MFTFNLTLFNSRPIKTRTLTLDVTVTAVVNRVQRPFRLVLSIIRRGTPKQILRLGVAAGGRLGQSAQSQQDQFGVREEEGETPLGLELITM